jgi:hypothetical protein
MQTHTRTHLNYINEIFQKCTETRKHIYGQGRLVAALLYSHRLGTLTTSTRSYIHAQSTRKTHTAQTSSHTAFKKHARTHTHITQSQPSITLNSKQNYGLTLLPSAWSAGKHSGLLLMVCLTFCFELLLVCCCGPACLLLSICC